jgi:putative radical SAM enzyme (TIGR03279 family)
MSISDLSHNYERARRKEMNTKISRVSPNSIAEEVDIEVGDTLISINNTPVKDIIDYKFLMADEYIEVEVEKKDGEIWAIEIEKEYEEDLGVEFENQIMDDARSCCNKCMFCFIDQLPKGMRESLYFKDDDSRLSFLQGNFVTLTNMKDEDIDRIIRYRISPINISVHTTNPELRVKMLNNRFAGNIVERLKKLAEAGISMNCQVVSVPGVNNGEELIKTVEDLYKFYPAIENIAVVPVGITKYREGLAKLELYNKPSAEAELDNIEKLQSKYVKEIGQPFVRLSDEFYITAGRELPGSDFYGEYEQLEDGIGMIRIFRDSIDSSVCDLSKTGKGSFTLVTGASAYSEILKAAEKILEKNININLKVKKIKNHYFGETITVAGLITGKDIIDQLSEESVNEYIIVPKNMLRSGEEIFLDDVTLEDLEKELNRKVIVCDYTGEDLINKINEHLKEE